MPFAEKHVYKINCVYGDENTIKCIKLLSKAKFKLIICYVQFGKTIIVKKCK